MYFVVPLSLRLSLPLPLLFYVVILERSEGSLYLQLQLQLPLLLFVLRRHPERSEGVPYFVVAVEISPERPRNQTRKTGPAAPKNP
jgi:hypothetical protein